MVTIEGQCAFVPTPLRPPPPPKSVFGGTHFFSRRYLADQADVTFACMQKLLG